MPSSDANAPRSIGLRASNSTHCTTCVAAAKCGVDMLRAMIVLACTLSVIGCGCRDVALNSVAPTELTLAVGESATLTYSTGGGCRSGDGFASVDLHEAPTIWHSSDTLVATVDFDVLRASIRRAETSPEIDQAALQFVARELPRIAAAHDQTLPRDIQDFVTRHSD